MSSPNELKKRNDATASMGNVALLFAASIGVSLRVVKKASGLDPADVMDPDARIPSDHIMKFLCLLAKLNPDKNISLELAGRVPLTFLGSLWRVIRHAPDLDTMGNMFIKNRHLIADQLEMEVLKNETEMILRIHHPHDDDDGGVGGEVCIGIAARIIRTYFGRGLLTRVQFRHAARSPLKVYETWFGVPVLFRAPFNALAVTIEAIDRPNRKVRPERNNTLRNRLLRLRHEIGLDDVTDELADIRVGIMRNGMRGDYTVRGLARHLAMSLRNLQRRLQASGTSASALLDDARHTKALELIADTHLSIEEIGSQLGFVSERGFRKAFERWTRKSPAQARREMV